MRLCWPFIMDHRHPSHVPWSAWGGGTWIRDPALRISPSQSPDVPLMRSTDNVHSSSQRCSHDLMVSTASDLMVTYRVLGHQDWPTGNASPKHTTVRAVSGRRWSFRLLASHPRSITIALPQERRKQVDVVWVKFQS
ncbi:hypothetical protein GGI35DRAFT_88720 [Trichoderma velutinum]